MSLLKGEPRQADIMAATDVEVLTVDKYLFLQLLAGTGMYDVVMITVVVVKVW